MPRHALLVATLGAFGSLLFSHVAVAQDTAGEHLPNAQEVREFVEALPEACRAPDLGLEAAAHDAAVADLADLNASAGCPTDADRADTSSLGVARLAQMEKNCEALKASAGPTLVAREASSARALRKAQRAAEACRKRVAAQEAEAAREEEAREKEERAQSEAARQEEAKRKAEAVKAQQARAKADAARARVEALTKACSETGAMSRCLSLPPTDLDACAQACFLARTKRIASVEQNAEGDCVQAFVDAKGRGRFSCEIPDASGPPLNEDKVKAFVISTMNPALNARDGAALDAAEKRLEAGFASYLLSKCTPTCRKRGPEELKEERDEALAEQRGPRLRLAYKRCMVVADSTLEARKLEAYDHDLYCEHIRKANARCRTANKCDWLEKYIHDEEDGCVYASVSDCPEGF